MKSDRKNCSLQYWVWGDKAAKGIPGPAAVSIVLKAWTTGGEDMPPELTPQLLTEGEIDYEVDRLKDELETVRIAAKHALQKVNARLLRINAGS